MGDGEGGKRGKEREEIGGKERGGGRVWGKGTSLAVRVIGYVQPGNIYNLWGAYLHYNYTENAPSLLLYMSQTLLLIDLGLYKYLILQSRAC